MTTINEAREKQKNFLEQLQKISPMPLYGACEFFDDKQKKYHPGKQYIIGKQLPLDHVTVAPNEIIYELDAKTYSANTEIAKRIIEALKNRNITPHIFASGGKGIHIHTWFDKIKITIPEIKNLYKQAQALTLTLKDIRIWQWNLILEEASINQNIRGVGKTIDIQPINFNEEDGKTHLIRICGGRKLNYHSDTAKTETMYKTYLTEENIKPQKPKITDYSKVEYPTEIKMYEINQNELATFLKKFIENKHKQKEKEHENIKIEKGYLTLPCVQTIINGLKEGQRTKGAQILSIACSVDKIPKTEAEIILKKYAEKCSQIGHEFTEAEALSWLNWIYEQDEVFWNCKFSKELELCNKECAYETINKKELYEILEDPNILKRIDKILAHTIIGEKKTRLLTFLCMLSKDFPTDKNWNIPSDPKSQALIFNADSASGKTYLPKQILPLFGEEDKDYHVFSRITKNALNYFEDMNMDGKIVFIEELQGYDESSNQLRLWISEGVLKLQTVEKIEDEKGHEVNKMVIKVTKGMPTFITGTAEDTIEFQLNTRCWIVGLDTSEKQTRDILEYQTQIDKGLIPRITKEITLIRNALKELKPYHYKIPYIEIIKDYLLRNSNEIEIRARRDFEKLRTIIKTVAYLHQRQRQKTIDDEGKEYIKCEVEDYKIAKEICENVIAASFKGVSANHIELIQLIQKQKWSMDDFTTSDVQRISGKSRTKVWNMLNYLEELGYIDSNRTFGGTNTYRLTQKNIITPNQLIDPYELERIIKEQAKNPSYKPYNDDNNTFSPVRVSSGNVPLPIPNEKNDKKPLPVPQKTEKPIKVAVQNKDGTIQENLSFENNETAKTQDTAEQEQIKLKIGVQVECDETASPCDFRLISTEAQPANNENQGLQCNTNNNKKNYIYISKEEQERSKIERVEKIKNNDKNETFIETKTITSILQDNDLMITKIINENELIKFIEQQPNKLIEIIDIQTHFNATDQQINDLLNKLKQEGILAEIRSGRVMLL